MQHRPGLHYLACNGLDLVNTMGHQLTGAYGFTTAIKLTVREFAPDKLIILGPGTTLG